MKRLSIINSAIIVLVCIFLSLTLWQCRKTGVIAKNLDRSVVTDSTVFGAFYDNNIIDESDVVPDVNDMIKTRGVQTVLREYCGTSNCHGTGAPVKPTLVSYNDIKPYIVPGNPEASRLWQYITTNDLDKAMPPVNSNYEVPTQDKVAIYNWIKNGAKEKPAIEDLRAPAIKVLVQGCSSANCHNQATATGGWARKGLIPGLTSADTAQYLYTNPSNGSSTIYCQVTNKAILDQIWGSYKDSVSKYYTDTLANASFRPFKTVSTPVSAVSTRGPLNSYHDILLDIIYPKNVRTSSSVVYTDPAGKKFYVRSDYLNSSDCFIRRIDSTLIFLNPRTGAAASASGNMAYDDGGLNASEIALIKAWYFADPNIPDVWKYGLNGAGIFKYKKSGTVITR